MASDDVGWFYGELTGDKPPLWNPDAPPKHGPPPTHLVVPLASESLEEVYSLAIVVGGLLFVLAAWTLVHENQRLRRPDRSA